jgi:hypothetical protein
VATIIRVVVVVVVVIFRLRHVIDHLVAVGAAVTARETVGSEGVDSAGVTEGAAVSVVTVVAAGTNKQKPPVVPWGGLYGYTI